MATFDGQDFQLQKRCNDKCQSCTAQSYPYNKVCNYSTSASACDSAAAICKTQKGVYCCPWFATSATAVYVILIHQNLLSTASCNLSSILHASKISAVEKAHFRSLFLPALRSKPRQAAFSLVLDCTALLPGGISVSISCPQHPQKQWRLEGSAPH